MKHELIRYASDNLVNGAEPRGTAHTHQLRLKPAGHVWSLYGREKVVVPVTARIGPSGAPHLETFEPDDVSAAIESDGATALLSVICFFADEAFFADVDVGQKCIGVGNGRLGR